MPEQPNLRVFPDLAALTEGALKLVISLIDEAVHARGQFYIALSGGNTPADLYRQLGSPPAVERIPWSQVQIFFGDERCVAADHPDSNFGMVRRTLLSTAPIPSDQVHRMAGELPPRVAAAMYEDELRTGFRIAPGALPRFDLILLGMGPDGHTASLFPFTEALKETQRLAVANHAPQLNTDRLTLTLPVLNNARSVTFLVAGEDKADALASTLEGRPEPDRYPAQSIRPHDGALTWLVDRHAAARLTSHSNLL
jgi:6-phosphogluconolactonase